MILRKCMAIGCSKVLTGLLEHDFCYECSSKYLGIDNAEVTHMEPDEIQAMGLHDRLETETEHKHNHYYRDVTHLKKIDPYRVAELFGVTNSCLQHILKKAMCAGNRGHKDTIRDLEDIRDTINRALEMYDEDQELI